MIHKGITYKLKPCNGGWPCGQCDLYKNVCDVVFRSTMTHNDKTCFSKGNENKNYKKVKP